MHFHYNRLQSLSPSTLQYLQDNNSLSTQEKYCRRWCHNERKQRTETCVNESGLESRIVLKSSPPSPPKKYCFRQNEIIFYRCHWVLPTVQHCSLATTEGIHKVWHNVSLCRHYTDTQTRHIMFTRGRHLHTHTHTQQQQNWFVLERQSSLEQCWALTLLVGR